MNLGELSIQKKTIVFVLALVSIVAGLLAYEKLGRLEDPEFTIKEALIVTPYPGASAEEVEAEVSNEIEKALQRLGQIKRVESTSTRGLSIVHAYMRDEYDKSRLPQVWDELRRKVQAVQGDLPPGVRTALIDDDFGDVYGVYVAITGDGYEEHELKDVADMLRRELLLVQDVKRIVFWGDQREAVYVEMDRERLATLDITQEQIFATLRSQNLAVDAGRISVGSRFIAIAPTGRYESVDELADLLISEPGAHAQIRLGDVATIRRGYVEPAQRVLRMTDKRVLRDGAEVPYGEVGTDPTDDGASVEVTTSGARAIGLGVSTVEGGNVVTMGEALTARLDELEPEIPVGVDVHVIALQPQAVTKAVNSFVINLLEAVAIVVVVLLLFMGLKSGLLIGFILFQTICASFIIMEMQGIMLQRISLGALIIALGMLVDNAIVVTEGMKTKIESGVPKVQAAREVVSQNQWPLLGATFVAVIAFAAIGVSPDDTGEFCRSLFLVLAISLLMSWLTAVTVTPLLCSFLFSPKQDAGAEAKDPYSGVLYSVYRRALKGVIRIRPVTILAVVGMFAASLYGFTKLPDGFFPASGSPQFTVDLWMPQGTHIDDTDATAARLAAYVAERDNTRTVASHAGEGGARFKLVYTPEQPNTAYAQLIVNVFDAGGIDQDITDIEAWASDNLPDALVYGKRFKIGPGKGGNIQVRFSGPDADVLRELAAEASSIIARDPATKYVRSDWRSREKVTVPVMAEERARRNGITRPMVAERIRAGFEGLPVGVFRDVHGESEDRLLEIVARAPVEERADIANVQHLSIYSPAANRNIPIRQILTRFETQWEEPIIRRRDRARTITLHADQVSGETSVLWNAVAPKVEAMFNAKRTSGELSSEYQLAWGGEYEDSNNAIGALATSIPVFVGVMVLIVIGLFNNLRQPLIIWLTVPLALIGVTAGLLLFNLPFGFMAFLGALSLSGMLIKNAIVLIDQINLNLSNGMNTYDAVIDSGVSRMRPVMMAAATTVLGMLPLITDIFFQGMAIAIMFGLTFATVLTLLFVPTLYVTLYGARPAPAVAS